MAFCWIKNMLTYEQLEPYIYKWAHHFREKYNRRFEVDELVNEVWAHGKVQQMDNIKLASNRAKFDMMDYVREQTTGRIMRKGVYGHRPKMISNIFAHRSDQYETNHTERSMVENLLQDYDTNTIEDKDEIDFFMQFPSDRQRMLITMHFLDGKTKKEISEELGIALPTVCNTIKRGIKACQEQRFIKSYNKKNKEKILVGVL